MHRNLYETYWDDTGVSSVGLYLAAGESLEQVMQRVRLALADVTDVVINSNRQIRELSMDIFDRTFAVTNVLRILAIGVAFVGVLSALLALQLERTKELGVLRATGFTPGQLWGMLSLQTGFMGLIAGLLALPLGLGLALGLISVVNQRSFGWSMQTLIPLDVLGQALLLSLAAALLAGIYPAWRMARTPPAVALREE